MSMLAVAGALLLWHQAAIGQDKAYVGAKACEACHQEEYDSFMANSKKAHSFNNIKKMEKKLTPDEYRECFQCHTTGYGQEGGFVSEARTPDLKNPGCEVCHGPGSLHAESEDPEDIVRKMAMEDCMTCHNQERINDFDFRPLLYSGGH
ncbi:MAG: cytochrome C [Desulfobacter sp.]|nr:MAG: cytochrome C [Desulfobacter sp.]